MLAVGAGLATLALVAACTALAWPAESPLVPLAGGRLVGDAAFAWAFLACAAAALAAYAAGIVLLLRRGACVAAVLAVACAIQLAPLGAPLLLSSDAWTYWLYGRIAAVQGGNPYAEPPAAYPDDPAFRWAGEAWRDTTSVYAPGFTLASEPVALAAGSSPDAAAWAFKALAAGAMVAAAALAARVAGRGAFAAAFVGWNPVLALHFAGGGHNDAWMAALALGAIALAQSRHRQLAGIAWALAVLVKWVPLVFLPLRALEARRLGRRVGAAGGHTGEARRASGRHRKRCLRGLVPAGLVVLGVATWRYGTDWANVLDPLTRNAQLSTSFAIPSRLEQAGLPEGVAVGLVAGAFVLAYAWLLREAWRGRARLGLAGGLVLLAVPYLAPWYLAWAVPLAAVEDDPPAWLLAVGLSAYLLPQTVPI